MALNYKGPYDDIIDMPHHVSKTHKHMSLYDRAAQFAPFSALTGYEDAIDIVKRKQQGVALLLYWSGLNTSYELALFLYMVIHHFYLNNNFNN